MRISTKGRYGLRAMINLAARFGQGPLSAEIIADEEGISAQYIHVIMSGLRAAGLVRTLRGAKGGYECARDPSSISALDIIGVLEGKTAPVDCIAYPSQCQRRQHCATHELWVDLAASIDAILTQTTLADLVTRQQAISD